MGMLQKRAGREKRAYTLEEDVAIVKSVQEGHSAKVIGQALGRSEFSIRYRIGWHQKETSPATMAELKTYHKERAASPAPAEASK